MADQALLTCRGTTTHRKCENAPGVGFVLSAFSVQLPQKGKETPQRNGFQKWQLRCQRERIWKLAGPRAYGPSHGRSGFRGGGLSSSTRQNLLPGGRLGSAAGEDYEDVDTFFLSAVDEVAAGLRGRGGGSWMPEAVPKFAPQRISTIHSLRSQVWSPPMSAE